MGPNTELNLKIWYWYLIKILNENNNFYEAIFFLFSSFFHPIGLEWRFILGWTILAPGWFLGLKRCLKLSLNWIFWFVAFIDTIISQYFITKGCWNNILECILCRMNIIEFTCYTLKFHNNNIANKRYSNLLPNCYNVLITYGKIRLMNCL